MIRLRDILLTLLATAGVFVVGMALLPPLLWLLEPAHTLMERWWAYWLQ